MLGIAGCAALGHAASLNGQWYVPVSEWAGANSLRPAGSWRGARVVVTNRVNRLEFEVDSAQARINGVNVRLCFPVASVRGAPHLAQLDLDKTLRPLLSPGSDPSPRRITTICLDPGHGGKDTGNHVGGLFGSNEKTYTLALAQELRDQLKRAGFNVILTRNRDSFVELPARVALANRVGADLFLSLHFNGTPSGKNEVDGVETYCITPVGASSSNAQGEGSRHGPTAANRSENKSLQLAYQMQKSLVQTLRAEDRGVRRARFAVLRDATMPALLIEGGYLSHPVEGKKIFDSAYRRQMAAAIVKGILAYQKPASVPAKVKSTAASAAAPVRKRAVKPPETYKFK